MIVASVSGLVDLRRTLPALAKRIEAAALKEYSIRSQDMHRDIIKGLSRAGSGRTYTTTFFMRGGKLFVGGPRKGKNLSPSHTASAPGAFPATDTGGLKRSVVFVPFKVQGASRVAAINARASYARPLEYGTRRMAARPFLRPAARFHFPIIRKAVRVAVRIALRRP